ncbi:MAG: hypothetical protein CSA33_04600 [Desulfobulbus propionicus]|nr:MAG: hypothetical protein CSA33_04600 [Desulfobulbus propionicus]
MKKMLLPESVQMKVVADFLSFQQMLIFFLRLAECLLKKTLLFTDFPEEPKCYFCLDQGTTLLWDTFWQPMILEYMCCQNATEDGIGWAEPWCTFGRNLRLFRKSTCICVPLSFG